MQSHKGYTATDLDFIGKNRGKSHDYSFWVGNMTTTWLFAYHGRAVRYTGGSLGCCILYRGMNLYRLAWCSCVPNVSCLVGRVGRGGQDSNSELLWCRSFDKSECFTWNWLVVVFLIGEFSCFFSFITIPGLEVWNFFPMQTYPTIRKSKETF